MWIDLDTREKAVGPCFAQLDLAPIVKASSSPHNVDFGGPLDGRRRVALHGRGARTALEWLATLAYPSARL
jgi:hypothetical protein